MCHLGLVLGPFVKLSMSISHHKTKVPLNRQKGNDDILCTFIITSRYIYRRVVRYFQKKSIQIHNFTYVFR